MAHAWGRSRDGKGCLGAPAGIYLQTGVKIPTPIPSVGIMHHRKTDIFSHNQKQEATACSIAVHDCCHVCPGHPD